MSAALQLPTLAAAAGAQAVWQAAKNPEKLVPTPVASPAAEQEIVPQNPVRTLAFYRKHTEKMLLRYLYASMLVGRAPEMLREPLSRGWASTRPVKTFEDAVIFVLDMEKCLARLSALDRMILSRVVLQAYSLAEAALLLRISERWIVARFGLALDYLTEILIEAELLDLPHFK
jgi:hypothetical protein